MKCQRHKFLDRKRGFVERLRQFEKRRDLAILRKRVQVGCEKVGQFGNLRRTLRREMMRREERNGCLGIEDPAMSALQMREKRTEPAGLAVDPENADRIGAREYEEVEAG